MSHVDQLDPRVETDKSLLFSSGIIRAHIELAAEQTGLPLDRVFPVRTESQP